VLADYYGSEVRKMRICQRSSQNLYPLIAADQKSFVDYVLEYLGNHLFSIASYVVRILPLSIFPQVIRYFSVSHEERTEQIWFVIAYIYICVTVRPGR